jgi:hypothetical protein
MSDRLPRTTLSRPKAPVVYKLVLRKGKFVTTAKCVRAKRVRTSDVVLSESVVQEEITDKAFLYNEKLKKLRRRMRYRVKKYHKDSFTVAPAFITFFRKNQQKQIAILERIENGELVEID